MYLFSKQTPLSTCAHTQSQGQGHSSSPPAFLGFKAHVHTRYTTPPFQGLGARAQRQLSACVQGQVSEQPAQGNQPQPNPNPHQGLALGLGLVRAIKVGSCVLQASVGRVSVDISAECRSPYFGWDSVACQSTWTDKHVGRHLADTSPPLGR